MLAFICIFTKLKRWSKSYEKNNERPLHEPATYSRHQSQTQLKTGIGVRR